MKKPVKNLESPEPIRLRIRMEATVVLDDESVFVTNLDKKLTVLRTILTTKFGRDAERAFDSWIQLVAREQNAVHQLLKRNEVRNG